MAIIPASVGRLNPKRSPDFFALSPAVTPHPSLIQSGAEGRSPEELLPLDFLEAAVPVVTTRGCCGLLDAVLTLRLC